MILPFAGKKTAGTLAMGAAALLALSACGSDGGDGGGGNYPSQPINVTAPAEPGSGWDTTARAVVASIEEEGLSDVPLPVQNQPGGTGCSWLTSMVGDAGGDTDIAITSLASQTMKQRGLCEYGPADATMIATLYTENFIVVAAADADITDFGSLMDALEDDPGSVPIAAAGDDRLPFALLADEAGIDPADIRFVDYEGGGEQTNAMLNGDVVAAIAGLSEFRGVLESGDIVPLVSFAPEPLADPFADVPIATDEGYDVELANWRGVYGPAEMPEEAVAYWEGVLSEMVESASWQETVDRNQWTPLFQTGEEMDTYIAEADQTVADGVEKTAIDG